MFTKKLVAFISLFGTSSFFASMGPNHWDPHHGRYASRVDFTQTLNRVRCNRCGSSFSTNSSHTCSSCPNCHKFHQGPCEVLKKKKKK